ncbi:MAG: hypothetical protein WCF08_04890, partial [Anaerolineaceae bacterium]
EIPFRLYKDCPQWCPPLKVGVRAQLDPNKHPFYEHSDAEHFIAVKGGRDVGRITALENKPFNKYHKVKDAEFYLFECEDDQQVADALFKTVFEWAKKRGLNHIVGPKGFSSFDGYGIQIEGFEEHQMMTMMNYNYPYYVKLVEKLGFTKAVDFVSCYLSRKSFRLPDKVHKAAELVQKRGTFTVKRFKNKKELVSWAQRIGEAYNKTFVNNWEYYPLTTREIKYALDDIMTVADPNLIKVITHNDEVVGFLLGFPDISAAFQRARGNLTPWAIVDLMMSLKRTDWLSGNGAGILPEYQGLGGNALMYSEMEKTLNTPGYNFEHLEMTQVAETAVQMRRDLINLGGKAYKNHRVYQKKI